MLPDNYREANELTTRSDFIEIRAKRLDAKHDNYAKLILNRNHIIAVGEIKHKDGKPTGYWYVEYGTPNDMCFVHPDSVQDLLNFIKEG